MMTLNEMKLAVCEKLPKLICFTDNYQTPVQPVLGAVCRWKYSNERINWSIEGLQVCHEAEKLLDIEEQMNYYHELESQTEDKDCYDAISTTYEQRLEALCRVWFPQNIKS